MKMKANLLAPAAVLVLLALSGCAPSTSAEEQPAATAAAAPAAALAATNETPALPVGEDAAPAASPATATNLPAGSVVNPDLVPPGSLRLTASAAEIAQLAHAGVAPSVVLAYVTNSLHTFNLGADQIVYFNDLGIAPEVVTAMIQHDQRIREASLQGAVAASPATPAPQSSVWAPAAPAAPAANVWQQPAAAPAPMAAESSAAPAPLPDERRPEQITVNCFHDALAPYGTWIHIEDHGRVWRPTVAVTTIGWRPYKHGGRWLWTDYGWYWYSDYSWGWAPFHYGRWFVHPHWGWVWWPDTVWGPSWVTWRYTGSYLGWAPLPPAAFWSPGIGFTYHGRRVGWGFGFGLSYTHFTFISYQRFCGRRLDRYCVPRHETPRIYKDSTVVNNIITGDNNVVINKGIGRDRIETVTRSEVPRVRVVRETAATPARLPGGRRFEQLSSDGRTLTVRRPVIAGTPSGAGTRDERAGGRGEGRAGAEATSANLSPAASMIGGARPSRQASPVSTRDEAPNREARPPSAGEAPARAESSRAENVRAPRPEPVRAAPAANAAAPVRAETRAAPAVRNDESRSDRVTVIGSRNDRPGARPERAAGVRNERPDPSGNLRLNAAAPAAPSAAAPAPVRPAVRQSVREDGRVEPARQPSIHPRDNRVRQTPPAIPASPRLSAPAAASQVIRVPATRRVETPAPRASHAVSRPEPQAPRVHGAPARSLPSPNFTPPARSVEPRQSPRANAPVRQFSAPESRSAGPAQGPGRAVNRGGPRNNAEDR